MTYSRNGVIMISKNGLTNFKELVQIAIEMDEKDKLIKAIGKMPFSIPDHKKVLDLINADPSQLEEAEEVDAMSAADMLDYVLVMDKMSSKTRYIIKDKKRTGSSNRTHRMLVKEGKDALIDYIKSEVKFSLNADKPVIVKREFDSVPPAILEFAPAEEMIFKKEGDESIYLNTWTSPSLACMTKENTPEKLERPEHYNLLENLIRNLAGYSEDGYIYIMNALAKAYQDKSFQMFILCFFGAQGIGKGVLEMIFREIFTGSHCGRGDEKHNIFTDSDNSMLKDKLVYFLDELPVGGDIYEAVKSIVGNATFPLKELNVNVRTYPNHAMLINSFNLDQEGQVKFKIAESDRRLSMFECWTPLTEVDGFKDFDDINDAINLFRLDSGSGIVEYFAWELATWDVDKALLRRPFQNETRQRWIDAGKDNTKDFYTAVLSKDIAYFEARANGISVGRYPVVDTMIRIFEGSFEPRLTTLTAIFSKMFGKDETVKVKNEVMSGRKKRVDGKKGDFIYDLGVSEISDASPIVIQVAENTAESWTASSIDLSNVYGELGLPPVIPEVIK